MTRALQQKIHVGCRELGLDSDGRRDLQLAVTGKASMKDMNEAELNSVLRRLKSDGFKASSGGKKQKLAPRADLRLVHVLWRELGAAGALRDPSRKGLNKFVRARFENTWQSVPADVDMLRQHDQIDQVIQALKSWGKRADIDFAWEDHQR
ncbi:gp16 family protein [Leisingera sp. NJS204]|uniref:gp16 family protein n=1 Tax=Leisingera sp. NJS204 TaxID=2508307 RepID=UPI0010109535|nr:regulatory protein GemA [Leisingera sp. NJS204]QAX29288.1 regulatory protein GemA [Leisingera sp. NJS204]